MKRLVLIGITSILILNPDSSYAELNDYEIRQLTFDDADHESVSASSAGELIWTQKVNGYWQAFSLDRGQLTFDNWHHMSPDINSHGEIVYIREKEGDAPRLYSSLRGQVSDGVEVSRPRINDRGEVIWRERCGSHYIICSNIVGKITDRASYEAYINNDGEVFYTGEASPNIIELFSTFKGQMTSRFSGDRPRANNCGEIVWEHETKVGNKIYKQIYSNIKGRVTSFYEKDIISVGDIDDDGIIYFTKIHDGNKQIFAAIPPKSPLTGKVVIAKEEKGLVAETYETPDRDVFDKIERLRQIDRLGGDFTFAIAKPSDGSTVTGTVDICVFSSNDENLDYCRFQADDKNIGWDNSVPFNFVWNSGYWDDGQHVIKVTGYFSNSAYPTKVAAIRVISSNGGVLTPSLSITSPAEGDMVSGTITIKTDATGNNFNYIYFCVSNKYKYWDDSDPYEFTFDTKLLSNGMHTIKAYGWHTQAGQAINDNVDVNVMN